MPDTQLAPPAPPAPPFEYDAPPPHQEYRLKFVTVAFHPFHPFTFMVPVFETILGHFTNIAPPAPPPLHHPLPVAVTQLAPADVIVPDVKLKDSLISINRTPPPFHPGTPLSCQPAPPPPPPQYPCRYPPKCESPVDPEPPAPLCVHPPPHAVVTTLKTLNPQFQAPAGPGEPVNQPPHTPPNQEILIVHQLITNLQEHLITATHPFVGAPENVSVPPVIVIEE